MSETTQTFEHVLELGAGETGTIEFRFPKDRRRMFHIKLAAVDRTAGVAEFVLDNFTRGYEMNQFVEGGAELPWTPLLPDRNAQIRATLDLDAGERFGIVSDDQFSHSLALVDAAWNGDRLRLTFEEQP
jgi:hypothetical protein